nr:MAG TPA: hypothetical protein [Caudoviricetes sp.]
MFCPILIVFHSFWLTLVIFYSKIYLGTFYFRTFCALSDNCDYIIIRNI